MPKIKIFLASRLHRVATVATLAAMTVLAPAPVRACQCSDEMRRDGKPLADKEINAQRLARAKTVVRGKFTFLSLGPQVRAGFTARMKVEKAIKGDLEGEVQVSTGFGNGDCGLASMVIGLMYYDKSVDIEILDDASSNIGMGTNLINNAGRQISMCGYFAESGPDRDPKVGQQQKR